MITTLTSLRQAVYVGSPSLSLRPRSLRAALKTGWDLLGKIEVSKRHHWVSDFEGRHPDHGWIFGNYETRVIAETREGLTHFLEHHPPHFLQYKVLDYLSSQKEGKNKK